MVQRKEAVKINKFTYRMPEPIVPSDSQQSCPVLTAVDMRAIAGLGKMTETRRERLIGWGMIPNPEPKSFRSGTRVMHLSEPEQV